MYVFIERCTKLLVMTAVIMSVYVSIQSGLQFTYFLSGLDYDVKSSSDINVYFKTIINWILASGFLCVPQLFDFIVQKIGNLCGLPKCYFKFIKIVLLVLILNGVITFWQKIPEICLWHLNQNYMENIHFYFHCSMWVVSLMIMIAVDITEITGLKSLFYYHLTNGTRNSFKSQQFDRFLSNMGFPGSTCLIIVLWAQKVMSLDKLILAVIWTIGIFASNKTDDEDIKYVARQLGKKKAQMYFSERITVSPLK